MPHRPPRRARPSLDRLEPRDNPGNAFGDFFSGLVGRAEVLTYYGVGAVKSAFEHGPPKHAESPKQRRLQQRAHELALAHVSVVAAVPVAVAPAIMNPGSAPSATTTTTATVHMPRR